MAKDLFEGLNKTIKDLEEGTLEIPEELKPLLERAVACQEQRKSLTPEEIEEWCNRMTSFIVGE
jgi:hypothetical protein